MPIDPSVAIGATLPFHSFTWSESDVLLYHLALGAGSRPGDNLDPAALRWTLDDADLQVLPSFGVVAPSFHETDPPPLDIPGCDIDLTQVVHASQEIRVNGPLPTSGVGTLRTRVTDIWDKGRAAIIWQEGVATSDSGKELWTVRSSIFVRGEGGFGGDRGSSTAVEKPDRPADASMSYDLTPQQALLYRLCGDRNPLHASPAFAKAAHFPAPIMHGLGTYGIVLREVTDAMLERDASRVAGFTGRFAGIVYPGETLYVDAWDEGDKIVVDATVGDERRPALDSCVVTKA